MNDIDQKPAHLDVSDIHVPTERVRHSGALIVSAIVDDGTGAGPWRHAVTYYWDPEDGDPRLDFVADVIGRGWTFAD